MTPNGAVFNKLHAIEPNISKKSYIPRLSRKEDVVLTRLRIGHTRLTHSYLLQREEQPVCIGCNEPLTVKHIVVDCVDFLQTRNMFFRVNNLKQVFQDVPVDNIILFLKMIRLYNKI